MAGQHNLHNHQIAIKFPHPVWRQIEIDAQIIADRIREAEEKGKMV